MKSFAITIFLAAASPVVAATLARTYVSTTGADTNACDRATPCLSLAAALFHTSSGGEVDILDSGDYGPVVITHPVTVDGGGSLVTTDFVSINSTGSVILRNFAVASTISEGVIVAGSPSLRVEHVSIGSAPGASLQYGVLCAGGTCSLDDVLIQNAHNGGSGAAIAVDGAGVKALVTRCTLIGSDIGIVAINGSTVQADRNLIQSNTVGVTAISNSTVRLSKNTITDNTLGIPPIAPGSSVVSFSNNRIFGNTTNGNPTVLTTTR